MSDYEAVRLKNVEDNKAFVSSMASCSSDDTLFCCFFADISVLSAGLGRLRAALHSPINVGRQLATGSIGRQ